MLLNATTLSKLPEHVNQPNYDRTKLHTKMVHLGFGAFHRAHQAVYTDHLTRLGLNDWGYCVMNLLGGEQQIQDLKQQDRLYSVTEMSANEWKTRIIGVVNQALHLYIDGAIHIIETLADPEVAIVSLTITEKGYCHFPSSGKLNEQHPAIVHDREHPLNPQSAIGIIVAALELRRQRQLNGFTVMSCDNMPENGHVTRNVILRFAELRDPSLAQWIQKYVSFPSTMVDRIVPAVTPETLKKVTQQLNGIEDHCAIACEPFIQWVIEDNFLYGRPHWEHVGAQLVSNVLPYEEMKLRMLNGSHSFLAYLGYLAGYASIDACMQDPAFVAAAYHLILREQAPTLTITGVDLRAYADTLITRYKNSALTHKTAQIAMDGSQKLPQRMLDSIRILLKQKRDFSCLAMGVAGWMRYVDGTDEQGNPIIINDPLAAEIQEAVAHSEQGEKRVKALLSINAIFGTDLITNNLFVENVTQAYLQLLEQGSKAAVKELAKLCLTHQ